MRKEIEERILNQFKKSKPQLLDLVLEAKGGTIPVEFFTDGIPDIAFYNVKEKKFKSISYPYKEDEVREILL